MEPKQVACPRCGAWNDAEGTRCLICGAPLPTASPPEGAAPPPEGATWLPLPAPPPAAAPAPPVVPQRRQSLPLALIVLGVVGVLGLCLVAGVGGLGALTYLGGGGNLPFLTPPTPTPIDPAALLVQANAAMSDVQTLHYNMIASFPDLPAGATEPQTVTVHLVGDVQFPDRYTMHTDQLGDLIVLSQDAYVSDPDHPGWVHHPASDVSPDTAPTNPTLLPRFIRFAHDPILGSDVVSGTLHLHRVNFVLDIAGMIAAQGPGSPGTVLGGSQVTCDALIGAEDSRLYQLVLQLQLSNGATGTVAADFSNFNGPAAIQAPANVAP